MYCPVFRCHQKSVSTISVENNPMRQIRVRDGAASFDQRLAIASLHHNVRSGGFPVMKSFVLILVGMTTLLAQDNKIHVIAFGAHPDDCDIRAAGTAALFAKLGHLVKFVSVTNGDAGHQTEGGGALAKRRRLEAKESARRLGIEYEVLDNHDGELLPSLDVRLQIIRRIRQWNRSEERRVGKE